MDKVTNSKAALDLKLIDTLENYEILVSIVSDCPHCFNLFKKEREQKVCADRGWQPAESAHSTGDGTYYGI